MSSPAVVIADQRCQDKLGANVFAVQFAELGADRIVDAALSLTGPPRGEGTPAIVLFTAGTTGESKAAVLTHRGILSTLQSLLLISHRISAAGQARPSPSRAVVSLPLFHIGGLQQLITPLVTGGTVVFTSGKFDPEQVVELIDRHSINLWGTPAPSYPTLNRPLSHAQTAWPH